MLNLFYMLKSRSIKCLLYFISFLCSFASEPITLDMLRYITIMYTIIDMHVYMRNYKMSALPFATALFHLHLFLAYKEYKLLIP